MNKINFMLLAGIVFIMTIIVMIMGILSMVGNGNGCFFRYNFPTEGANSVNPSSSSDEIFVDTITDVVSLSGGAVSADGTKYGQWTNTSMEVDQGQIVKFNVIGEVSLCKSYVPAWNLQNNSNLNNQGEKIEIPRVNPSASPLSLSFAANLGEWRNIAELYRDDKLVVSVSKEQQGSGVTLYNNFTGATDSADCRENKTSYSPICGKYSIYQGNYTRSCSSRVERQCEYACRIESFRPWPAKNKIDWIYGERTREDAERNCDRQNRIDIVSKSIREINCQDVTVYDTNSAPMPEPYKNDGRYTTAFSKNFAALTNTNFNPPCPVAIPAQHFWYTTQSQGPTGLISRLDSAENPTNKNFRGGNYDFVEFLIDQSFYEEDLYNIIYNNIHQDDRKFLQFRYHYNDGWNYGGSTGGYVINIQHTKCRRINGLQAKNTDADIFTGAIEYILVSGVDPNEENLEATGIIDVDQDGNGSIEGAADLENPHQLWMRIVNAPDKYEESDGGYTVNFTSKRALLNFDDVVLNPLITSIKTLLSDTSEKIFSGMVCYNVDDKGNCSNLFNYIRAILSLYVMLYAAMYLLGSVKVTAQDLVIRVSKIAIVAGLINESTFNFFNVYIFDFINNFSAQIIANMSGLNGYLAVTEDSSPFAFVNGVMTKIFFSQAFISQLFALMALNLGGIIYFILALVGVVLFVIVVFKSIAIYLMALIGVAILLALAPIFLTFMLFDFTRHLFDSWINNIMRLIFEPIILLAGIIILAMLFTIYLDIITSFSVCWKCALPFRIPFLGMIDAIDGLDLTNVPLFCLNWFAPWGEDATTQNAVGFHHCIILMILGYCMHGYIDFSNKITSYIFGGTGAASNAGAQIISDVAATGKAGLNALSGKLSDKLSNMGSDKDVQEQDSGDDGEKSSSRTSVNTQQSKDQFSSK